MFSNELQSRIYHNLTHEERIYIINNITWLKWWEILNILNLDELYILSKQPENNIIKYFKKNHSQLIDEPIQQLTTTNLLKNKLV